MSERLGDYELGEKLGEGGMAAVYSARRGSNDFAIKVLSLQPDDSEEFARRFVREFETISMLNHPNILKTFGYGQDGNKLYLVMELLTGGTLGALIRQSHRGGVQARPLTPQRIASLLTQIASALTYAHTRGIVHRDLKPQNVMLNAQGDAILTDFGIAKVLHETSTITRTGMIVGTPPYMSPEQWRGETIDGRADVYALGAMLFEMITGQTPFVAESSLSMMHLHVYQPVPSIRRMRPNVPAQVEWIINKALAKHRDNRFGSADELAAAFRAVAGDAGDWQVPPEVRRSPADDRTWILGEHPAQPRIGTPEQDADTFVPMSPALAAEQERRALAALALDSLAGISRQGTRTINLPPLSTQDRFKGRQKELSDLARLLAEHVRLISIYGRGGVGKTALACKVLADLSLATDGSAPDGIVYLSAISTGISLDRVLADFGRLLGGDAQVTLEALRGDGQSASQKTAALLETLKDGRYVLLLDNLETLQNVEHGELTDPDLKAFIETVLAQGGTLTLLITSREPVALSPELKPQERLIPLDQGLALEDAISLLRASDPDGLAGLRDAPDTQLTRIVEKTRGFPRALEAFVGLLLQDSLLDIDALLDDARAGPRADSEIVSLLVQQAIDRLSPAALCVMEALAIYNLPVKQPVIEFLLAPYVDTSDTRTVLNRLVRSYFVNFNRVSGTFALHPIDREYCHANIPAGTPADPLDDPAFYTRHALHSRAASFYERQEKPKEAWNSVDDVRPQLARFDHLVQAEQFETAANLLWSLDSEYLFLWGQFTRLLAMYDRVRDRVNDPQLARKCLFGMAQSLINTGRMAEAIQAAEQMLESARRDGDLNDEGLALYILGNACMQFGQIERAITYYQAGIPISQQLGNRKREARQLGNLATAYWYQGDIERAVETYRQVIPITQEIGDRYAEGGVLGNLAAAYMDKGQYQQALETFQPALQIARDVGDVSGESMTLGNMGQARSHIGDYLGAVADLRASLHLADEANLTYIKSYAGGYLTTALLHLGDLAGAQQAAAQARLVDEPTNNDSNAVIHGIVLLRRGDRSAAQAAFESAIQLADEAIQETPDANKHHFVRGLAHAGLLLLTDEPVQIAVEDYQKARTLSKEAGILSEELFLLETLMACPGGERLAPIRAILTPTNLTQGENL